MSLDVTSLPTFGKDSIVEWVVDHADEWIRYRDTEHKKRWDEYYRLWRGIWSPQDAERLRERSRAVMPTLQQAVESAVAEQEEAVFGRLRWFDIEDDVEDELEEDMLRAAILLREDFELAGVNHAISQAMILGAIYGTGIGKILTERMPRRKVVNRLVPIDPREFAIDPVARTIDAAMGVVHHMQVPRHQVIAKQQAGIYNKIDTGAIDDPESMNPNPDEDDRGWTDTEKVLIYEYHGKVPAELIGAPAEGPQMSWLDENLVEAIVTIGNKGTLLRTVLNPFKDNDRSFIAYQHDTVPNTFWGRGIMEKGYWPQKVLDSEIRARTEALAFSTHPMMAINSTMIPRGQGFEVRPGRNIFLTGPVSDNIEPIQFPPPDPQTYRQTADMERMIEQGTGQLQAASPSDINLKNSTASGVSMVLSSAVKRSKRTLFNLERNFLGPLVRKSLLRYQQFDKRRYPSGDVRFKVMGTMGMVARELETQQLLQMLQLIPPDTPPFWQMVSLMVEQTGLSQRERVMRVVDQLVEASMQPQEPEPDLGGQARMLSAQVRQMEAEAEIPMKAKQQEIEEARVFVEAERVKVEKARISFDAEIREAAEAAKVAKTESESILNLAKAQAEATQSELEQLRLLVEGLKPAEGASQPPPAVDVKALAREVAKLVKNGSRERSGPVRVDRDERGLVTAVNGRGVNRDPATNLIVGVE